MGSGGTWGDIVLDDSADVHISLSDIKDYFYACGIPAALCDFFCLPPISGEAAWNMLQSSERSGDMSSSAWVREYDEVFPCFQVMPMGWSWAFSFAQVAHAWQVEEAVPWQAGCIMRDQCPPPRFLPHTSVALPYCDNLAVASGRAG